MDTGPCAWCHDVAATTHAIALDDGGAAWICGAQHERALRRTLQTLAARRWALWFGLIGSIGAMAAAGLDPRLRMLLPAGFAALGATLLYAPIPTPQTIEGIGLRRSIRWVRGLAALCVVAGGIAAVAIGMSSGPDQPSGRSPTARNMGRTWPPTPTVAGSRSASRAETSVRTMANTSEGSRFTRRARASG